MTSDTNRSTASKPAPELTPAERKDLRAAAHSLHPVVTIADAGLSPSVLAEVERALDAHGLIKIRVHGDDRLRREALLGEVCERAHCAPVQMIGKLLVVWRPKRETGTGGDAGTSRRTAPRQPKKLVGARTEEGASKPTSAASRHRPAPDLAGRRPPASPLAGPPVSRQAGP
ncbi:MAG: YhbY family RNA-binding protein, partial [Gammaproteobacteria bacterium]